MLRTWNTVTLYLTQSSQNLLAENLRPMTSVAPAVNADPADISTNAKPIVSSKRMQKCINLKTKLHPDEWYKGSTQ